MVRDLDDFLGGAETLEELEELMDKFLSRCRSGGVYLNPSKFNIAMDGESLVFTGLQVGSDGYSMDPARLDAIKCFQRPQMNKELQRWLGLCTSLGQFASSPLRNRLPLQRHMLRKNWNHNHLTSLHRFMKKSVKLSTFKKNISSLAVYASYHIWLCRSDASFPLPPFLPAPFQ